MAEPKRVTRVYQVSHTPKILEATPLYTSILTEELDRIIRERDFYKRSALELKNQLDTIVKTNTDRLEAPMHGEECG